MWKTGKFGFENNVPEGSGLYGGEKKVSTEEDGIEEEKVEVETLKKGNFYKEKVEEAEEEGIK